MRVHSLALVLSLPIWIHAQEEPAKEEKAEAPKEPAVEQVSETKFKLGAIEFDSATREIRFPGVVNMTQGILEYVLVHVNGKDHEALFTTEISPTDLNIVLKLLRYKSGDGDLFHGFYPPGELPEFEPLGEGIDMFATWPGSIENPVYDLIRDEKGDSSMTPLPWIYNGSEIVNGRFEAEYEGSFVAIYRDPLALFNTQHPRAIDDETWFPIKANIPAMETPVTLILKPTALKAVQD